MVSAHCIAKPLFPPVRTGLCLVRFILAGCACRQSKDAGRACVDRADKVEPCPNNKRRCLGVARNPLLM
ncbi:MAG: hypothetical protein LBD59_08580 [Prevotellaceae bacterium]|nr:hypothetical protein [Prevotellaceae bacterium]